MTSRQQAINQLFKLTINGKLDGGLSNIRVDAPSVLTGAALEWWQGASYKQHQSAVYLLNANVHYYFGTRDDYGMWTCPACIDRLVSDYRDETSPIKLR